LPSSLFATLGGLREVCAVPAEARPPAPRSCRTGPAWCSPPHPPPRQLTRPVGTHTCARWGQPCGPLRPKSAGNRPGNGLTLARAPPLLLVTPLLLHHDIGRHAAPTLTLRRAGATTLILRPARPRVQKRACARVLGQAQKRCQALCCQQSAPGSWTLVWDTRGFAPGTGRGRCTEHLEAGRRAGGVLHTTRVVRGWCGRGGDEGDRDHSPEEGAPSGRSASEDTSSPQLRAESRGGGARLKVGGVLKLGRADSAVVMITAPPLSPPSPPSLT
jgi:hypothetical protein